MEVLEQIQAYIASQPEPKRGEMQTLHQLIRQASPGCKEWFSDGRDNTGKVVSNPTIGYGFISLIYANKTTRDFFKIGLSANKNGISIHILGIEDKTYLIRTFGNTLGKASITGYCIKFKTLKEINIEVLEAAIRFGFEGSE